MKCKEYLEDLIDRHGEDYAIQSIKNAIEHHTKIYELHKSEKSITTIRFFNNCLEIKYPKTTLF